MRQLENAYALIIGVDNAKKVDIFLKDAQAMYDVLSDEALVLDFALATRSNTCGDSGGNNESAATKVAVTAAAAARQRGSDSGGSSNNGCTSNNYSLDPDIAEPVEIQLYKKSRWTW